MERLNLDFKGPLPSVTRSKYFLTVIDEYSRFPFVIPTPDILTPTFIKCLDSIYSLCGMTEYVHSDRGKSFMSAELVKYLTDRGIASSHSTRYHSIGNGQVERYNGIVWKAIRLALASKGLPVSHWERVLPDALHSIHSLLTTATNTTPHEHFFNFQRKSSQGKSLPSWLIQVPYSFVNSENQVSMTISLKKLSHVNPTYAYVRHNEGRESTVSLSDLAPYPRNDENQQSTSSKPEIPTEHTDTALESACDENVKEVEDVDVNREVETEVMNPSTDNLRRSTRTKRKPQKYGFEED